MMCGLFSLSNWFELPWIVLTRAGLVFCNAPLILPSLRCTYALLHIPLPASYRTLPYCYVTCALLFWSTVLSSAACLCLNAYDASVWLTPEGERCFCTCSTCIQKAALCIQNAPALSFPVSALMPDMVWETLFNVPPIGGRGTLFGLIDRALYFEIPEREQIIESAPERHLRHISIYWSLPHPSNGLPSIPRPLHRTSVSLLLWLTWPCRLLKTTVYTSRSYVEHPLWGLVFGSVVRWRPPVARFSLSLSESSHFLFIC